jgi:peptide/nickel transport system permease protein
MTTPPPRSSTATAPAGPPPDEGPAPIEHGRRSRLRNRLRVIGATTRENWILFKKNRIGVVGLVIIIVFGLAAIAHPILMATVWDPTIYGPVTGHSAPEVELTVVEEVTDPGSEIDLQRAQLRHDPQAEVGDTLTARVQPAPPSLRHPLGTDPNGRDVLSQLMVGAQTAFGMGFIAAITTVLFATVIGAVAAYFRGWVDTSLMRAADFFLLLPPIPFLIFLSALYDINMVTLGLVFGIVSGVGPTAIVLKSQALSVSVKPFIDAARIAGGGHFHIIFRHLVPNIVPLSFLYMMFTVTGAIAAEAILSLFGLISVPMSWGIMINVADTGGYITRGFAYWWLLIPAGLAVTLLAGAFYLVGRGLDEVVNPRLRRR